MTEMNIAEKNILEEIISRLRILYHPKTIYLFGSYAWGNPHKESDFDIAVIIGSSDEKPYKRIQRGIKELWDIKKSIDLLVYTEKEFHLRAVHPSTLQHRIEEKGIKIYEAA
jgi:predicted nucleotidyltransferase